MALMVRQRGALAAPANLPTTFTVQISNRDFYTYLLIRAIQNLLLKGQKKHQLFLRLKKQLQ